MLVTNCGTGPLTSVNLASKAQPHPRPQQWNSNCKWNIRRESTMTVRLVIKWKPEGPPPVSIPVSAAPVIAAAVNRNQERVDHRYHKRLPVKYQLSVFAEDQQAAQLPLPARGINMSRSGVLIETEEPLPIGSMVYIKVK